MSWWHHKGIFSTFLQYIPRNMHTVFALLCFVAVIQWLIFPYPSGLLHWHCGNLTIAPVPAKQPWWIWINTSCEFIMNDCITTTKQSTTKPCAYFLGYTVPIYEGVLLITSGIQQNSSNAELWFFLKLVWIRCWKKKKKTSCQRSETPWLICDIVIFILWKNPYKHNSQAAKSNISWFMVTQSDISAKSARCQGVWSWHGNQYWLNASHMLIRSVFSGTAGLSVVTEDWWKQSSLSRYDNICFQSNIPVVWNILAILDMIGWKTRKK